MNLVECGKLARVPLGGTWYRAMVPSYATPVHAIAFAHTKTAPTRFNEGHGGFATLYLAEDPMVALFEVEAMLGSPHSTWLPVPGRNWTILSVSVVLQAIVDLTRALPQATLGTTVQELTGDWRGYRLRSAIPSVSQPAGVPAPTQELGAALYAVDGLEGFLSTSAKVPTHQILIVFPDKLAAGSELVCHDDKGKLIFKIAPAAARRSRRRPKRSR